MDNIFKNMTLQRRMMAAFVFMGAIVLVVALVGAIGNFRLSGRLESIASDAYPSTVALWKINEGQTQVQSSDRMLLNEAINTEQRRREIARIKNAWNQIKVFKNMIKFRATTAKTNFIKNLNRCGKGGLRLTNNSKN